ncbi:MAG: hypothetical protein AMXMBFR20_12480 [Planctomycetia bacterium]|nr:hypothetical protein [Planctomycetota bacterium]
MICLSLVLHCLLIAQQPAQPPVAGGPLADPIVDGSYGFSIQPPSDWRIVRQRVPERRGVTLVRMIHPISAGQAEEIVVKQTTTTQSVAMDEMLKQVAHNLELEFSGLEVQSQQLQPIADKPGAILAATFFRDGVRKLRLQAIIRHKPQSYYVILYDGPASSKQTSEPLFNLVVNSFRIIGGDLEDQQLTTALEEGESFLGSIKPDQLRRAIVPEEALQFEYKGKVIGFVLLRQSEDVRDGKPGVAMKERGWTFEADGNARRLQTNMFLSFDLSSESWKTSVTTLVPEQRDRPTYLEVTLEEGLRAGDILLSNQSYSLNQPATENPPTKLPATYISRILARMLPRLVSEISSQKILAFVTFDHSRAGLIAKVVDFKGKSELPTGAARGPVFRVEDRERLAANPSAIFLNEKRQAVLIEAGDLKMTPTTAAAMEKQFGSRIVEAEARMAELEASYNKDAERFNSRGKR